jgi:hypothetical protein
LTFWWLLRRVGSYHWWVWLLYLLPLLFLVAVCVRWAALTGLDQPVLTDDPR